MISHLALRWRKKKSKKRGYELPSPHRSNLQKIGLLEWVKLREEKGIPTPRITIENYAMEHFRISERTAQMWAKEVTEEPQSVLQTFAVEFKTGTGKKIE